MLSLFGVSPVLISKSKDAGVTISQSFPGTFEVSCNGKSFGSIMVKGQAITLAKAGSLGPSSKKAVAVQFEKALGAALAFSGVDVGASVSMSIPSSLSVDSLSQSIVGSSGSVEFSQPSPSSSVGLSLGQKIAGTSHNSYYSVFAVYSNMVLAGRYKNGVLSVRAVTKGAITSSLATNLTDLGFTKKTSGNGYYSAHYSCGELNLAHKTIGAILGGFGLVNLKGQKTEGVFA